MVAITIEAPVRATEDPAKVEAAILAIFPDASVRRGSAGVTGTTANLDTLMKKVREERVLDAARGALFRGRIDHSATRFELNKQAAFVGRVNFNEVTHPLGDLVVTVETDDLEVLLDSIAPPTPQEIAQGRGSAAMRAALHKEEAALERLGGAIDSGFDDEDWTAEEE